MTSCSKNKGRPQYSYSAYDFLYVPDQDTVQQPTYDQPSAEPSKETPDTTDSTYARVLSTSEQTEQQLSKHISPPVENGYASPDVKNQPEQSQPQPITQAPTCSYSYVLPPESSQQLEEPQQHAPLDASTTTKNDYSFVLSPEDNEQPEEPQQQTTVGAVLETIGGANKPQPIYQNIAMSNTQSPEPPEVAGEHVYATVIMQNKKKLRSAEVPAEKPSAEMVEPTNSPTLQPVPPNPGYSGENKLHAVAIWSMFHV